MKTKLPKTIKVVVKASTESGMQSTDGWQLSDYPHLAASRCFDDEKKWVVTHVRTGLKLSSKMFNRADAIRLMALLVPIADWSKTGKQLGKMKGVIRATKEIVGQFS